MTKLRMSGAVQTTQRHVRYGREQLSHLECLTDDAGSVLQRWLGVPNVQQPPRDLQRGRVRGQQMKPIVRTEDVKRGEEWGRGARFSV